MIVALMVLVLSRRPSTPAPPPHEGALERDRQEVILYQLLDEDDHEDDNHRRDIDAPEIWQDAPDRSQGGLGDRIEEVPDRTDNITAGIDDVESNEPAQDRRCDNQINIKLEGHQNDFEQGAHGDLAGVRGVFMYRPLHAGTTHGAK